MCSKFDFVRFSTNISNKSSIIKYDFWCFDIDFWEKIYCETDKQIIDAIFAIFDTRFNVEIEKRENFDAMTERETISIQNVDFFDVVIDAINDVSENKNFEIDFDSLKDNVNINIDSFDDENVAKNVNIAIVILTSFVFDVKKKIIDTNVAIDVNIANSFDVNFAISFANFVNFWWWFCTWI